MGLLASSTVTPRSTAVTPPSMTSTGPAQDAVLQPLVLPLLPLSVRVAGRDGPQLVCHYCYLLTRVADEC